MWIDEYLEAITAVQKYLPDVCWNNISCSIFGDVIIFRPSTPNWYVVYERESKKLYRRFNDTWRNGDHWELIDENWNWGA